MTFFRRARQAARSPEGAGPAPGRRRRRCRAVPSAAPPWWPRWAAAFTSPCRASCEPAPVGSASWRLCRARSDRADLRDLDLIRQCLAVAGLGGLCDLIVRDEGPEMSLTRDSSPSFRPRPSLDIGCWTFGCGSGDSTCILGRLLPHTELVGVELEPRLLDLAVARARHHGLTRVVFHPMQNPNSLPPPSAASTTSSSALCSSTSCLMNAPPRPLGGPGTRPRALQNQTPHRWFPYEHHSTRLPLIADQLPAPAAGRAGREALVAHPHGAKPLGEFKGPSPRRPRGETEREVLQAIGDPTAEAMEPHAMRDRVDLWYSLLSSRHRTIKQALWLVLSRSIASPARC